LNLGFAYFLGEGAPRDLVLAYMWVHLAGAGGLVEALEYRDSIGKEMAPEQITKAIALAAEKAQEIAKRLADQQEVYNRRFLDYSLGQ
jgi:TPR repeat protein